MVFDNVMLCMIL